MPGKGQVRRSIVENGPDPLASRVWNELADRTALELSAEGAPASIRVGMKGSPETTYYGDPGPLMVPRLSYAARNTFAAENATQALPATSSPTTGSTDLRSLVGEYGL